MLEPRLEKKLKLNLEKQKEIEKNIILGRLETSEDFKVADQKQKPLETKIEELKITVREITSEEIKLRKLPNQTKGLVITKIEDNSPLKNSIELESIILEAQKKKIRNVNDLKQAVKQVLNSNQKTILLVIFNSENQRRYIGKTRLNYDLKVQNYFNLWTNCFR